MRPGGAVLLTGSAEIMPGFDPEMFRITPTRIVSWGIEAGRLAAAARTVTTPTDSGSGAPRVYSQGQQD